MRISGIETHPGDSGTEMPSLYGRLRELPVETASLIAEDIGPRPPLSLGEAKAAALLDARLRRVGMRLSAESYRAPRLPGYDSVAIAILAAIGIISFYWLPLPAIAIFAACLAIALLALAFDDTPLLTRRAPSQNVIATRAAADELRWRLVLLAPLSSPPAIGRFAVTLGRGLFHRILRMAAAAALLGCGIAAMLPLPFDTRLILWYAQIAIAAPLLLLSVAALIAQHAPATPGAVSYAGAIATLVSSAAQLTDLKHTELWVVGIGAFNGRAGMNDLLRRYPFDRRQTLFVGLDGIGAGELCYGAVKGSLRRKAADPLLVRLAAGVVESGLAHARARAVKGVTLAGMLYARGLRAISLAGLDAHSYVPRQYERDDTFDALQTTQLDVAVQFVVALARALDNEPAGA